MLIELLTSKRTDDRIRLLKLMKMIRATSKIILADHFAELLFSDPHVRIVGRKEDVLRVKDKVMAVLDAKVSD